MYIYTINAIAMQSRCSDSCFSFWYLEEQSVLTVVRKSLNDRLDHYLLTTDYHAQVLVAAGLEWEVRTG